MQSEELYQNTQENQAQQTNRRLNLSYLVDDTPRKTVPWTMIFLGGFCLLLIGSGVWVASKKESDIIHIHVLRSREDLKILAAYYYQDPGKWQRIFWANREKLSKKGSLKIGDKIRIPLSQKEKDDYIKRMTKDKRRK